MPPKGSAFINSFGRRVDISDQLTPDGVTDNTAIIQQYLDDSTVGEVHIGRPGTYIVKWDGSKTVTANSATHKVCLTIGSNKAFTGVPGVVIQLENYSNAYILFNSTPSTFNTNIYIGGGIQFVGNYFTHTQQTSGTTNLYFGHAVCLCNVIHFTIENAIFTLFQKYAMCIDACSFGRIVNIYADRQRSDVVHLTGSCKSIEVDGVFGASYVVEEAFTITGGQGTGSFNTGELLTDGFGAYGYLVTDSGATLTAYMTVGTFQSSGTLTGTVSGKTRTYSGYVDTPQGDNNVALVPSEGNYYRQFSAFGAHTMRDISVANVLVDSLTGSYQPIRLVGASVDTIQDVSFKNVRGKSSVGHGIALGDDAGIGSVGCVMRNISFEDISIEVPAGFAMINLSGVGVKSVKIKNIRAASCSQAILVSNAGVAIESLDIDGYESRRASGIGIFCKVESSTTVNNLTIRNGDFEFGTSNLDILRNQGTIGCAAVNGLFIRNNSDSTPGGNVVYALGGTITDLFLSNIQGTIKNQNVMNINGGTVTNTLGNNIVLHTSTSAGRLMLVSSGSAPFGSFANLTFDTTTGTGSNSMIEYGVASDAYYNFTNLKTLGGYMIGVNLYAAATVNIGIHNWQCGPHSGGAGTLLFRANTSASAKIRLTGAGYVINSSAGTPITTANSATIEVNNQDFRCDAKLLFGVLGDRVWTTATGTGMPATVGPCICNLGGIPGTATYEKDGRTF